MANYRVTVGMPTLPIREWPVVIGLLTVENLPEQPTFLESDGAGSVKLLRREEGDPPTDPQTLAIGLCIPAVDELEAATTAISLVAAKLAATHNRAHYPTLYHLRPAA